MSEEFHSTLKIYCKYMKGDNIVMCLTKGQNFVLINLLENFSINILLGPLKSLTFSSA